MAQKYDRSLDAVKGLAVVLMVLCHGLLLLSDTSAAPWAQGLCDGVNLIAFPTFLFSFGRTVWLAYLQKPYAAALLPMLRTALRCYAVFFLSALSYWLLYRGETLTLNLCVDLLLLRRLGGYSEFMAAFVVYALLTALLFPLLRRLARSTVGTAIACGLCAACALLPVQWVADVRLGLVLGMNRPSCYPAVPYGVFFLLGILWQARPDSHRVVTWTGLIVTAATTAYCAAVLHALPQRFPLSLLWLLLPMGAPMVLTGTISFLSGRAPMLMDSLLGGMGRRSLYALLLSNVLLFILRGAQAQDASRPLWGLCWTAGVLAVIAFTARLAGRGDSRRMPAEKAR